jgi:hypothetical protein
MNYLYHHQFLTVWYSSQHNFLLHVFQEYIVSFCNFFTLHASDTPPFLPVNKMKLNIQVGHWMVCLGILPLVVIISCARNLTRLCPNFLGFIGLLWYPSWTKDIQYDWIHYTHFSSENIFLFHFFVLINSYMAMQLSLQFSLPPIFNTA